METYKLARQHSNDRGYKTFEFQTHTKQNKTEEWERKDQNTIGRIPGSELKFIDAWSDWFWEFKEKRSLEI